MIPLPRLTKLAHVSHGSHTSSRYRSTACIALPILGREKYNLCAPFSRNLTRSTHLLVEQERDTGGNPRFLRTREEAAAGAGFQERP
jgi:hypothetical protein